MISIKQISSILPALGLVAFSVIGLAIAALRPTGTPSLPLGILVAGADSGKAAQVIAAAGGRLVSAGGWLHAVTAVSDDPDFADKLYRAGASLVFRADNAVGCGGASLSNARTS